MTETRCATCGRLKSDHSYNGDAYGVCGDFVDKAQAWDAIAEKNAEIARLRSELQEADAEIEKFSDISFAQHQKEFATLKAFAKQLSDALLRVRPLGGSELFVKRCGDYYADPDYCGKMIEELRVSLDREIRARIRGEKAAAHSSTLRAPIEIVEGSQASE